jgi:hypothetical protein
LLFSQLYICNNIITGRQFIWQENLFNLLDNRRFEALHLDLSSSRSINVAINAIFKKTNTLYGLIHNGAYGQVGALEDVNRFHRRALYNDAG